MYPLYLFHISRRLLRFQARLPRLLVVVRKMKFWRISSKVFWQTGKTRPAKAVVGRRQEVLPPIATVWTSARAQAVVLSRLAVVQ